MLQASSPDAAVQDVAVQDAAVQALPLDALALRLGALEPGQILTLVGVDNAAVRGAASAAPTLSRQLLELDLAETRTTTQTVNRILDDLAELGLALWPDWSGSGEVGSPPDVLAVWRREAARLATAGRRPRFRRTAPRVGLTQLLAAIDPSGLVLCATLDAQPPIAAAQIAALEWCAGAGASILILCPSRPAFTPPFDRILYGAFEVRRPPAPVLERLIVPQGRPHGGSDTERRVQAALLRDPELAPLFAYNTCVETCAPGFTPRVDLVWTEGRVVVELDGLEHQGNPNYGDDRHRDYELARRLPGFTPDQCAGRHRSSARDREDQACGAVPPIRRGPFVTDKLTPTQTLLMWGLLAKQGIAKQADILPAPKAADRKALETAKLILASKVSRSLWLKLDDRGWGWAADHLRDPLPLAQRALNDMMIRLHDHLAKSDASLADFIGEALPSPTADATPAVARKAKALAEPRRSTARKRSKPTLTKVRTEIERAYLTVTAGRKGVEARLSEVRPHLAHLDRADVDEALAAIRRGDKKARLLRIDDQRSITPADIAAALPFAGESLHILWIMK